MPASWSEDPSVQLYAIAALNCATFSRHHQQGESILETVSAEIWRWKEEFGRHFFYFYFGGTGSWQKH
ncbi:unnamed protein product [Camellia sinensis]